MAGTSSWRLATDGGYLCELALFVRDAVGLEIVGVAEDVPPLTGAVSDLAHALEVDARRDAGHQWQSWWLQTLDLEFHDTEQQLDARARVRQRIAEHQAVCDPTAFAALTDRPALQAAVRASFDAFKRWESARPSPGRDGLAGSRLDWSLMKQIAEDVAFDRRVSLDVVQASVVLLPVHGTWWRRVAPGAVLCSTAAAADSATARVLLRDAFDSRVMR